MFIYTYGKCQESMRQIKRKSGRRSLERCYHVDIIVILESTHNFHGNRKPLHFERNKEKFTRYLGKIRHIVMDISAPEHRFHYIGKKGAILGAYKNEWSTRHHLRNALWDVNDNDIVTWGDVDEILSHKFILAMKLCRWQHQHFTIWSSGTFSD